MLRGRTNAQGRSLILLLLAAVLATACNAEFDVSIVVEEDGSGIVATEILLDQEATQGLLDLGDDATLPLSDLAQAGWDVGRPVQESTGETMIRAEKAFGTTTQFAEIMGELSGDDGIIRDFALVRTQSFGRVDYALTGTIDPTGGFAAFTDDDLEAALGRTLESIVTADPYNASLGDVTVEVTVMLPGELQEDGSTGAVENEQQRPLGVWRTDLDGQPVDVALRSARRSTSAQVLRGVAVVAAVLAALVAFGQLLRIVGSRRRRKPAAKVRPTDARGRRSEPTPARAPEPAVPIHQGSSGYRVVALDGMGVLYREGNDMTELLIPFARKRGATASDEEIVLKARLLSLGRMTPADFWKAIGVDGDPNELDAAYLASHQLMPGVVRYLRALRDSGVRAACITNDCAAWAMKLRAGHSLEGLIDPWVVSGSVGVRKPDAPLFEVLRRVTGEPPSSILVIDDDLANLDAARDLGFGTAWFSAHGDRADARGHGVVRSFDAVNVVDTKDVVLEEGAEAKD